MKKTVLFLASFLLLLADTFAQGCPMCKAGVESSQATPGAKSVGMGLNGGILMLLGAVYFIIFSVGIMWYRKYRKNQLSE